MSNKQQPPNKKPLVDIIITTAGRFDCLATCLDAIYREAQSHPVSIYIVDDYSPAEEWIANRELFEYQEEKDPAHNVVLFKTKRHTQSEGFPRSANDGARDGKAPIIMFISDDVELLPGALDTVVRRFDDVSIGVVGIKLLFPLNSTSPIRPAGKVQHIGMCLNIRGEPIHPLVGWSTEHEKCNKSREVSLVTGACFSVRRNVFNKAGGFNPVYGKGTFEDMDMCMSARQLGQKVFVDCGAVGYHYVGATVEKQKQAYPLQNNLIIFHTRWQNSNLLIWDEVNFW